MELAGFSRDSGNSGVFNRGDNTGALELLLANDRSSHCGHKKTPGQMSRGCNRVNAMLCSV
jgi:hypothetical protein